MRQILHVDMDAFYASVEQRDNPELRGKPVLVGGPSQRGVVAAASYEARVFGARSAMPMAQALRLCPDAIVVSGRHGRYAEVSHSVFTIFRRYTPLVEGLSLDEAFLDVTASRSLYGDGEAIARRIKAAIRDELSLTASAGVAPSKFVAKIASDLRKPDGLVVVPDGTVRAFLAKLPIERMWGIGPKTAPRAHEAGFHTMGDLADASDERLERAFGNGGPYMGALARGEDEREVIPDHDAKSIGAEETFEKDLTDKDALARHLLSQSERVAARLHAEGLAARTVTVKLKYADFTLKTRAKTLEEPVADTDTIFRTARALLERFEIPRRGVRLTGVSLSDLAPREARPVLFPDPKAARGRAIEGVAAKLRERFGDATLTRAALLDPKKRDPK